MSESFFNLFKAELKVSNVWSDAARQAAAEKKREDAKGSSDYAAEIESRAIASGKKKDYELASGAHEYAADTNREAQEGYRSSQLGFTFHQKKAKFHTDKAAEMQAKADGIKVSNSVGDVFSSSVESPADLKEHVEPNRGDLAVFDKGIVKKTDVGHGTAAGQDGDGGPRMTLADDVTGTGGTENKEVEGIKNSRRIWYAPKRKL